MKKILFVLVALFVVTISFGIVGCGTLYTPPQTYSFVNHRVYDKPYDVVWKNTVRWFAESGNPIKNIDKESGIIATDRNVGIDVFDTTWCDCGKGGMFYAVVAASSSRITDVSVSWNVFLESMEDGRTKVAVSVRYSSIFTTTGSDHSVSTQNRPCNSKGTLEMEILDYISSK